MPLPSVPINNLTAPDNYTAASTVDTGNEFDHIVVDVANQAIYWSLKQYNPPLQTPQSGSWGPDVYMAPGSRVVDRDGIAGVRVRAAIPAASLPSGQAQAVVTVEAVG